MIGRGALGADFEIIGACAVALLAAWCARMMSESVIGAWLARERRRRRRIERELRARARCSACGAVRCVEFVDPDAELVEALRAGFRFLDRARAIEQRRVS